jgi:hypothetical protein
VERRSVVPNSYIVDTPLVPHLHVMVLRDVTVQVFEEVVGFLGVELQDPRGKPTVRYKALSQSSSLGKYNEGRMRYPRLTNSDLYPVTGCVLMTGLKTRPED